MNGFRDAKDRLLIIITINSMLLSDCSIAMVKHYSVSYSSTYSKNNCHVRKYAAAAQILRST